MHNVEHNDYRRDGPNKGNWKNRVPDKVRLTTTADYFVKQALTAWGDSFSDSDNFQLLKDISMMVINDSDDVFDSLLGFMDKFNNEDERKVTLLDIK